MLVMDIYHTLACLMRDTVTYFQSQRRGAGAWDCMFWGMEFSEFMFR